MKRILATVLATVALVATLAGPAAASATAADGARTVTQQQAVAKLRLLYHWGLPVQYVVDGGTAIYPIKGSTSAGDLPGLTEYRAYKELRRCFNCSFPVKGAPKAYPKNGQLVNLVACLGRLGCKKAPVRTYTVIEHGTFQYLKLVAQKGHFDGAGSAIYFRFRIDESNNNLLLDVRAYVAKPTVPDAVNKAAANLTWRRFGNQLGGNMWKYQNCRPWCHN